MPKPIDPNDPNTFRARDERCREIIESLQSGGRHFSREYHVDGRVELWTADDQPKVGATIYPDGSSDLIWADGSKTHDPVCS